jgi:DNA-binding GntR family transcriptional regulator
MTTSTLAENVALALRDAILDGQYVCGERLVEITLAHELNVSQNTVRDSLRILEQDGWVVKLARRGVYVRNFTPEDAIEVYTLLTEVESLALTWAIMEMDKARLNELRRWIVQARKHAQMFARKPTIEAIFCFHETIGEVAGRSLTLVFLRRLYTYARLLESLRQARAIRNPAELDTYVTAHEQLFKLIEAGDGAGANAALRRQISTYCDLLVPILRNI